MVSAVEDLYVKLPRNSGGVKVAIIAENADVGRKTFFYCRNDRINNSVFIGCCKSPSWQEGLQWGEGH